MFFFLALLFSYLSFVSGQNPYYYQPFHLYLNPQSSTYLSYYQYLPSYHNTQSNVYYKYPPVYYYPNISFTENITTIQPYVKQESSAILNNVSGVINIYSIMFVFMMMKIMLHG